MILLLILHNAQIFSVFILLISKPVGMTFKIHVYRTGLLGVLENIVN